MFKKLTHKKIEFTPSMERAIDYPPTPVKFNLPTWYKDLASNINGAKNTAKERAMSNNAVPFTVKRCVPVSDYLTSGYLLKTFTDILISQNVERNPVDLQWSLPIGEDLNYIIGGHPHNQCPIKFEHKNRDYIKFFPGWKIKTPPGYSCMFYQNFYDQEDRFVLFPAIVDTDKYDALISFPGYIKTTEADFKIPAGTPLVIAYPFKRDDWNMKINDEPISDLKSNAFKRFGQHFENVYRNFFHSKKRFD